MKQFNIFINLILISIFILFSVVFTYILINEPLLGFILKSHTTLRNIFFLFLYKIIHLHSDFVIFSLGLSFILFYGFSPISLFKAAHYKIFILTAPLILAISVFYFENFWFQRYKNIYVQKEKKIKNKIFNNSIDYTKFFNNKIEKYRFDNEEILFFIKNKNKNYAEGFVIYNGKFLNIGKFQCNIKNNNFQIKSFSGKVINISLSKNENPLWTRLKQKYDKIYPYAFLLFILIPLSLLFNNSGWHLRTIIFLIISVPLYIYAFNYYNKLILSIKINLKFPFKLLEINDILLSISYIVIGNFLFKIANSVRKIKTRIDIAKIKRINH